MAQELLSIEALDEHIVSRFKRLDADTYDILLDVRQFDERGGSLLWGLEKTCDWVAWRCDRSPTTAREQVRVARALKHLPAMSAAMTTGELSYSKVRSLTRVANPGNEEDLVEFGLKNTTRHVESYYRELRMGDPSSTGIAEKAHTNRSLRVRRNRDKDTMSVSIELPVEQGELLEKALNKARDEECLQVPDLVDTSWVVRQADAFVTMLRDYLSDCSDSGKPAGARHAGECADRDHEKPKSSSDNYLVNIHVDQSALAGDVGRSSVPIETVKRLCCDGQAVVLTETEKGEPLSVGRKTRVIPKAIKRAVHARDREICRFPGCRNHRFVEVHHIEHWSNGGETSIDNLMLLCTKHHTLVHEGGFRIDKDFEDRWTFYRPDGVAVPELGYHARDMVDKATGEVLENPPRGGLLSAVEKLVNEPPPPEYFC